MKKWRSEKNRHELYLQGKPVCTLHFDPACGYYCEAQIGNGIRDENFGFCTQTEAKQSTEAWYAAQMRLSYQMHRRCANECLDKLEELGVEGPILGRK